MGALASILSRYCGAVGIPEWVDYNPDKGKCSAFTHFRGFIAALDLAPAKVALANKHKRAQFKMASVASSVSEGTDLSRA